MYPVLQIEDNAPDLPEQLGSKRKFWLHIGEQVYLFKIGKEMVDRLTKLVAIFEGLDFGRNRAEGDDLLGDAYEYLMRHFATESGKSKGQFYTPAEVSRVMSMVIDLDKAGRADQSIYDPTCGSGSLLLKAHDEARSRTGAERRAPISKISGATVIRGSLTDISSNRDMYTSERGLTQKGLNEIRALPADTVLVTCIASIGKNAILKIEGGCNQQISAVIPNKNNSAEFLYYLFEASKQYLLANAGTTATSIISKAAFGELAFRVPSLPEQAAIAAVLSDMDAEIAALEGRRDKIRLLKQGMMQELLTGRIRLLKSTSAAYC